MKIGVDGGGTKTAFILLSPQGQLLAEHRAPGCNPNIVGADLARATLQDGLSALLAKTLGGPPGTPVTRTLLCMAGSPAFWRDVGQSLHGFGQVDVFDDSLPALELATDGTPGLVLHAGTGSFVAARSPDGFVHYAGGLGWRFGDPGSGYDLARRTVSAALLEMQGWSLPTRLTTLVRDHTRLADSISITRHFYTHPEPNRHLAALAPALLRLADEGDEAALAVITESVTDLLQLAEALLAKLFAGWHRDHLAAGVTGPILTHPAVARILAVRSSLRLRPCTEPPIEGVRRLLLRL